jgi:hypothetical protein
MLESGLAQCPSIPPSSVAVDSFLGSLNLTLPSGDKEELNGLYSQLWISEMSKGGQSSVNISITILSSVKEIVHTFTGVFLV